MSKFSGFYGPWEHPVCRQCLEEKPHCLHLALVQCFRPHGDHTDGRVPVVVDHEEMLLKEVQPLPWRAFHFPGRFAMCHNYPDCRRGDSCRFSHSELNRIAWSTKKTTLLRVGKTIGKSNNHLLYCKSTAFPLVCKTCFVVHKRAVWLLWLKCIEPDSHNNTARVRVALSNDSKAVVQVKEIPSWISNITSLERCNAQGCDNVNHCHSDEELEYWRFSLMRNMCKVSYRNAKESFDLFCERHTYPDDISSSSLMRVLESDEVLSKDNYKRCFRLLLYLEELEQSRKMISECDTDAQLQIRGGKGYLYGVAYASIEYATFHHAKVTVLATSNASHTFVPSQISKEVFNHESVLCLDKIPGRLLRCQGPVHLHFEVQSYDTIPRALAKVNPDLLEKLIPTKLRSWRRKQMHFHRIKKGILDDEYQADALQQLLKCDPAYPFLILGPFGTGKTRLLVNAVVNLDSHQQRNYILVCTHMNRGADYFCEHYCNEFNNQNPSLRPTRVVANDHARSQVIAPQATLVVTPDQVTGRHRLLVTTFITASQLGNMQIQYGLQFTHILIDEGAQSTEPEVLCALTLADSTTKIIIAGDNHQVGPQTSVISKPALENGLGISLLQRLYDCYRGTKLAKTHSFTLLTNYRCHPTILTLSSSLFYEHTLLSRSTSKPHPLAPYPLVFACTSFDDSDLKSLPGFDDKEACVIIDKVLEFHHHWMNHWEELEEAAGRVLSIGVLASTKDQVSLLRTKLRTKNSDLFYSGRVNIMPTYNIQGEEFVAVFLSTVEPTNSSGKIWDPTHTICNEYVFNTVVTRAQSLVYCVGNPFRLLKISKEVDVGFWAEFLRRCIACNSLALFINAQKENVPSKIKQLWAEVSFEDRFAKQSAAESIDSVLDRYITDLHKRDEFKCSVSLIQKPKAGGVKMKWVNTKDDEHTGSIVLCTLNFQSFRKAQAITDDGKSIEIDSLSNRRGAFEGDQVPIVVNPYTKKGRVLLDRATEAAMQEQHFGERFLCRVDPNNSIMFFPLDNRLPKFANLPTLTKKERKGVVCFDPASIGSSPKISDFIPLDVAKSMVFVVYYLRWRRNLIYPLGIIVGALPSAQSLLAGLTLLKIEHNVIGAQLSSITQFSQQPPSPYPHVTSAFTIDPECAEDLDDAFSIEKIPGDQKFKIGIHITDVGALIKKGSDVDKAAMARGCSLYLKERLVSDMLPPDAVKTASFTPGNCVNAFTIFSTITLVDGKVEGYTTPGIELNKVTSQRKFSYKEAQSLLQKSFPTSYSQIAPGCYAWKIHILWKFVKFLAFNRLKQAAFVVQSKEPGVEECIEAHRLVEELMIFTNVTVAKYLLRKHPDSNYQLRKRADLILKQQEPPEEKSLVELRKSHSKSLACFNSLISHSSKSIPSDDFKVALLFDLVQKVNQCLDRGDVAQAIHFLANESNHPQFLTANSQLIGIKRPSSYVTVSDGQQQRHDDLACDCYTHFTSPIRRYVDIVMQRQLRAVIENKPRPYTKKELDSICTEADKASKRSKIFESSLNGVALSEELLQSSQQFDACIVEKDKREIQLRFHDPAMSSVGRHRWSIQYKLLRATSLHSGPSQNDFTTGEWKVKVCSCTGATDTLRLNPGLMNVCLKSDKESSKNESVMATFLACEEDFATDNWTKQDFHLKFKPTTLAVPYKNWKKVLALLQSGEMPKTAKVQAQLKDNFQVEDVSKSPATDLLVKKSPLWILTIQRLLEFAEVMKVWVAASQEKHLLLPTIQLLEVAPTVRVCIQHNSSPAQCFTGAITTNASRKAYGDIHRYFSLWEEVLLAEASVKSITDSEFLVIQDVVIKWPRLQARFDSSGKTFYQLAETTNAEIVFEKDFCNSSLQFFDFNIGGLLCIRYTAQTCNTMFVLHMVIENVQDDVDDTKVLTRRTLKLKFVGRSTNYISPAMKSVIEQRIHCEVQLVPLSIPYRRTYRCLNQLRSFDSSHLARKIALGNATCKSKFVKQSLPLGDRQLKIAFSLWNQDKDPVHLNKYQADAIKTAWSNEFTLIQGPPGTGKSVTGAHLAYALVMKLRMEHSHKPVLKENSSDAPLKPCVMYCGPSHQSVNVVLELLLQEGSAAGGDLADATIRVYSKAVEKKDFPGPKSDSDVFQKERTNAKSKPGYDKYALHHIIRSRNKNLEVFDELFSRLSMQNKIPSAKRQEEYRKSIHAAELAALKRADLILCTCSEASSHRIIKSVIPEYVIIDEAAMAMEPECMIPILRAKHVVLIGDHKQLQPVIEHTPAELNGLGVSLFQRYVEQVGVEPILLEEQYRMIHSICEFPSNQFYEGKLKTSQRLAYRHQLTGLERFWPSKYPFLFCDLMSSEKESHTGHHKAVRVGLESKYNQTEAIRVTQIVNVLIEKFKVKPDKIAVLTPYSAQREEIKRQLDNKVEIKTITESQGSEYDIVVLSTVRSQREEEMPNCEGQPDIGWLRANLGFITNPHQINVGITRSKHGLVIIGNKSLLSFDPTWKKLIQHFNNRNCIRRCTEFLAHISRQ